MFNSFALVMAIIFTSLTVRRLYIRAFGFRQWLVLYESRLVEGGY